MHETCSTVVPFIRGHAPGVLRGLHLLEQKSMIAFFDTENIVKSMVL